MRLRGAVATTGAAISAGVIYRAFIQHRDARAFAIRTPNGVDEAMFCPVGGIEQWIQIRGEDRDNPVLLFLHGGPGFSYRASLRRFREWEARFTLVHWDQRGAGKTFGRNGRSHAGPLTIDRMTDDAIEVTELLCARLQKKKVVLLGHSWGTVLGLTAISRRPDLFQLYLGTGQVVHSARNEAISYERALCLARERSLQKAIRGLDAVGHPPYSDYKTWLEKSKWSTYVETVARCAPHASSPDALAASFLLAPRYSLVDVYDQFASQKFSVARLYDELMTFDAVALGTRFEVPMLFIQGASDLQTVTSLVEEYERRIDAPRKELVVLSASGHTAMTTASARFLEELDTQNLH